METKKVSLPKKKIIVPYGSIKKIAQEVGCCVKTAENALLFKRDNDIARRIQKTAIVNHGGKPFGISIQSILKF